MDRSDFTAVCVGILGIAVGFGGVWAAGFAPAEPETENVLVTIDATDRPYTADVIAGCDDGPVVANATVTDDWFDETVGYERAELRVVVFTEVTVTDGGARYANATLDEGESVALDLCRQTIDGTVVDVQGVSVDG